MIIDGLLIGGVLVQGYNFVKSIQTDEKAVKKYAKAFENSEKARQMVDNKSTEVNQKVNNLAKKKKSIIDVSLPKFVEVYAEIKNVSIKRKERSDLTVYKSQIKNVCDLKYLDVCLKKEITNSELLAGYFFTGLGGLALNDSNRYLSAANKQMSLANSELEEAKTIVAVLESFEEYVKRLSNVTIVFNYFLLNSINVVSDIIKKNGYDCNNYTDYELSLLLSCENIALGLIELINLPIIINNDRETSDAIEKIGKAEKDIEKIKMIMKM